MPLHIDRVQTELDVLPNSSDPTTRSPSAPTQVSGAMDGMLKERLRPLVLEILQEELDRLRRQQGRP